MTGPEGNSEFCFPRISMFPATNSLFPKGPVIKWKQNKANFEKRAEIPATTSGHLWSRATAVNISRVIVNCFPFDVTVFAMLPAHGIWR